MGRIFCDYRQRARYYMYDNQLINSHEYDGIAQQFEEHLVIVNFRASNHTVVYLGK